MARPPLPIEPGTVYGMLTVVGPGERLVRENGTTDYTSLCRCECSKTVTILNVSLRAERRSSCGCKLKYHGLSYLPEYHSYRAMISRCHYPKDKNYCNFGARGITVCAEWRESFPAFLAAIGSRPSLKHTVDRIDKTKGYEPGNTKWTTCAERINPWSSQTIECAGEVKTLAQWAFLLGVKHGVLFHRLIRAGWTPAEGQAPASYRGTK